MDEAAAKEFLVTTVRGDVWMMACLAAVRDVALPDGWVGAGFVRRAVWDALTAAATPSPLDDVDVLYFDPRDPTSEAERRHEACLHRAMAGVPWSVRNQARMHHRNGDAPYADTEDGIRHWLETPTAVALCLDSAGGLDLLAPFGLGDLMAMRIRPTPSGRRRRSNYRGRIVTKNWRQIYPTARIEF